MFLPEQNPMDRGAWQATKYGVSKESDPTEQLTHSLSDILYIHTFPVVFIILLYFKVHPCFVTSIRSLLLLTAEYYYIECVNHILFIHSSADGHLDCFHFMATVNNAAVNSGTQVSI